MYGYIYKTTNLINGKIYIGQHKHLGWDNNYYGSGKALQCAIKKYGRKSFKCELIESCETKSQLNEREIDWIAYYQELYKCYNITGGGEGRTATHSKKTREKLSKSLSGRKISKEVCAHGEINCDYSVQR